MKRNIDDVRKLFAEKNIVLLTEEYNNNTQRLKVRDSKGKEYFTTVKQFLRKKKGDRFRITYETAKELIESKGFTVVSDKSEYNNSRSSIKIICKNGHETKAIYNDIKNGHGCKFCGYETTKEKIKFSYEFIKSNFEDAGYTLLSKEYINNRQKLDFICDKGHVGSMSFDSFSSGNRCYTCGIEICSNKRKVDINLLQNTIKQSNYKIISLDNYKNNKDLFLVECNKGHQYYTRWNDFQQGHRCPSCFSEFSIAEKSIFNIIKKIFPDATDNNFTIIKPLELDIVIPSKKTAIEYCGLYWHSEIAGKNKRYHLNKLEMCKKAGYRLITIFEDEWINKSDIVKERLKTILGVKTSERIYARKCEVKEIDSYTASCFCNKNHIQGYTPSKIKLGLFYNKNLVAIMTFAAPSIAKGSSNEEYELSRFCSDFNFSVIGGASKLFSYFTRKYKPKTVLSYADRRWSEGYLYNKLGFNLIHYSEPNYWYFKKGNIERIHRFNFRKSMLSQKLEMFDEKITEWENMKLNNYNRIWDCGNIKFVWSI